MSVYLVESENGTPHYFYDIDEALDALAHPLSSGYLLQIDDDGNRLIWYGESFESSFYAGDGVWYAKYEWDSFHDGYSEDSYFQTVESDDFYSDSSDLF